MYTFIGSTMKQIDKSTIKYTLRGIFYSFNLHTQVRISTEIVWDARNTYLNYKYSLHIPKMVSPTYPLSQALITV